MTNAAIQSQAPSAPEPLIGLAYLLREAYAGTDLRALGALLIERTQKNPTDANALMDLSTVLLLRGDPTLAMAVQGEALKLQALYHLPTAQGRAARLRVLAIMTPGDLMANTPLEFLLENSDIALDVVYVTPEQPIPEAVPEHDVLFIAVGESDRTRGLLVHLSELAKIWPRPVLNQPLRSLLLSRDGAAAVLKGAAGISMPLTVRVDRATLTRIGTGEIDVTGLLADGDFPIIARPVGSHAGKGLVKLETPAQIAAYLDELSTAEFFISRFVDYRSRDGLFRKYRVVFIEGRAWLCHMAISEHWMIHYLNAGMSDDAAKRAEEADAMANFDSQFGLRHGPAFTALIEGFGLDYIGIDCAETQDGQLLIFEIDTGMVVHAIDPVDLFPYKQPQMRRVFAAFQTLITHTAAQPIAVDRHAG